MPTLIYSPGVRVYIATEKHGILDVSDDLTSGSMVRRVDGVSTFDCQIMNTRRKYDGVFTPNDRIIVFFKRLTWLREFTGYLNSVPLKTVWPQDIPISASCSLKRIMYYYWDPEHPTTTTMIMSAFSAGQLGNTDNGAGGSADGGVSNVIMTILEKVAGWPRTNVHIGAIPDNWYDIMIRIATRVADWSSEAQEAGLAYLQTLSPGAIFSGTNTNPADPLTNGIVAGTGDYAGSLTSSVYSGQSLSSTQKGNAETIISTGMTLLSTKVPDSSARNHAVLTALITSIQEANLLNLPSQAVPESISLPHDTYSDGSIPSGDHDSVGLFQQRAGWGSVQERMTPATSATKFYNALIARSGWESTSPGVLAQQVQVSAYPSAYAPHLPVAQAILAEAVHNQQTRAAASPSTGYATPSLGQTTGVAFRDQAVALVQRYPGIPYTQQYGGTQPSIIGANPPPGLDCSSFVQSIYMRITGSVSPCPRTAHEQAAWCKPVSVAVALATPGALVFKTNGGTSGVYHVEVSMGDGHTTVGAHRPGKPASVEDSGSSYWTTGGLAGIMPGITYGGGTAATSTTSAQPTMEHAGGSGAQPLAGVSTPAAPYHYSAQGTPYPDGKNPGADYFAQGNNTNVQAIEDGTIVSADSSGWGADYGNQVIMQVGPFRVMYGSLASIASPMTPGANVSIGTVVGTVGATGRTATPRLHLEVRKSPYGYTDTINPATFITAGASAPSTSTPTGGTDTGTVAPGTPTTGTGSDLSTVQPYSSLPGYNPNDKIDQLFGSQGWVVIPPAADDPDVQKAVAFTGVLALMNDTPMLGYIKNLFYSTMRSFCSAPNGDLIGWFPDYYGLWGSAAVLRLEQIEVSDFNVMWSDDNLITHQFAQAAVSTGFVLASGSASSGATNGLLDDTYRLLSTHGLANIDNPDLLEAMFGVPPDNAAQFTAYVYQKFGARPNYYSAEGLWGPKAELFLAVHMFMIQWAYQYRADVPVTFMPEAWPGMLAQIPSLDFQAYITAVTHSFQFGEQGGFQTTLNTTAPAYMPKDGKPDPSSALFGLPLAGNYSPGRGIGNNPDVYTNPYGGGGHLVNDDGTRVPTAGNLTGPDTTPPDAITGTGSDEGQAGDDGG